MTNKKSNPKLITIVGYGTFITKGHWKDKQNLEVCKVQNYRRILLEGNWFPYVLPDKGNSFKALKFSVNEKELHDLDYYEGVSSGLYERVKTQVILKDKTTEEAFIYVPTEKTIRDHNLTLEIDNEDKWVKEIKKFPEILAKFPKLID